MVKGKGQPSFVQPVTKDTDWLGCLLHLHRELGHLDRKAENLTHYQQEMLSDLRDRWSEAAISSLHDWWRYDTEALRTRGGHSQTSTLTRIELMFWINSRSNVISERQRNEIVFGLPGKASDWKQWHRHESTLVHGLPMNSCVYC